MPLVEEGLVMALGFGRKKNALPDPSTNTEPSTTQDYLAQAMGSTVQRVPKKKKQTTVLDSGGQPYRGQNRMA